MTATDTLVTERHEDAAGRHLALFDQARTYRYLLAHRWADGPRIAFVMLNPSTATATEHDATLRRVLGFARRQNAAALTVLNLFALRSTDPGLLGVHSDPVGPANDQILRAEIHRADLVIAAWGTHGALHRRADTVAALLAPARPQCLGLTGNGQPRHPLYLPADTPLTPYRPPAPTDDPATVPGDLLALEIEHRAEKARVAELRRSQPGACGYRAYRLGKQIAQHRWLIARPVGAERRAARKALRTAADTAQRQAAA